MRNDCRYSRFSCLDPKAKFVFVMFCIYLLQIGFTLALLLFVLGFSILADTFLGITAVEKVN